MGLTLLSNSPENSMAIKSICSKRGSSLARRVLHMAALNNVKVDKGSGTPVNPVVYDYYTRKCSGRKAVAMGAVMHKICNIIFAMLRDNNLLKSSLRKNTADALPQNIPIRSGRLHNQHSILNI